MLSLILIVLIIALGMGCVRRASLVLATAGTLENRAYSVWDEVSVAEGSSPD